MLRVLHFSDVHVDFPLRAMPWRQMLNKRLLGGANLALRRRQHFIEARTKLAQLADFAAAQEVDLVLGTGDYTTLGTEPELRAAREAIAPLTRRPLGLFTVPGNHDVYMPDAVADRRVERVFGPLLTGQNGLAGTEPGVWPAVRLFGDSLAVIAVNSARPNPQPWRSSGRIPEAQIRELGRLLGEPELQRRNLFLITHYAPRRSDGSPDRYSHGLENADELLAACAPAPRLAILHGHIHDRFRLSPPSAPAHLFCAGSTTCEGREGFWLFDVEAERVRATAGGYRDGDYRLEEATAFEF
ncbi:MAG: metallophosphoesterase [Myxococcales bacterium]|nr:metallophosphoesterase [Myxococcales bacterium]